MALLSIVVPAHDEQDNVEPLCESVKATLEALAPPLAFELIVVDDGSRDATAERVAAICRRDARVKLVSLSRRFGHQVALTAGLDAAAGDAVVFMDGDLQHPPELLGALIARWREGNDVVYTVRTGTPDAGWLKRATSALFYRAFRRLTHIDVPFHAADFRLVDRRVADALRSLRERTRFLRGLVSWVGFRAVAVPYQAAPRRSGRTKYGAFEMLHFAIDGIVSFTHLPLYLAVYSGMLLSALAFLYSLYVLYVRFFTTQAVTGWASVIMLLTAIGGLQLLVLGVLGIYLGKIYEEVKQRPLYFVERSIGFEAGTARRLGGQGSAA